MARHEVKDPGLVGTGKLIVHADDFGLSEKVNDGILHAHLHGILTSASVMANGRAFEHAIRICRSVPTLDVGVHLTLVEEPPVLPREQIPSLVNGEGRFHRHAMTFLKKYVAGRIRLTEVRRELEAQIERVASSGIGISHLDSHQHLHILPQILNLTVDLAGEYGIPAIRLPYETPRFYMLGSRKTFSRLPQLLGLNLFCQLGRKAIPLRTAHFAGFFFGGNLQKKNLHKALQFLPSTETCELMCHPGLEDEYAAYRHWRYHWAEELLALTDPEIADFLSARGIRLISYRQLANL
jgi:hopanoid biosynthesis associated protein HpnK